MDSLIDLSKQYTLRNGTSVTLIGIDHSLDQPVYGKTKLYNEAKSQQIEQWNLDGHYYSEVESPYDLVEAPRVVYVHIYSYEYQRGYACFAAHKADGNQTGLLARVRVEFTPGQLDE